VRAAALLLAVSAATLVPVVLLPTQIVDLFRPQTQVPTASIPPVAQTLVAPADRLSSVGFFLTFTDGFRAGATARVEIASETTGATLRTAARSVGPGLQIPPDVIRPTWFDFAPIPHSRGMPVRATLSVSGPGIDVWRTDSDTYVEGAASIDGRPQHVDLAFATRHYGTWSERLGRLSFWSPLWLVVPAAVATLALALAAGLAAAARVRSS
jgi:hypothetical protein